MSFLRIALCSHTWKLCTFSHTSMPSAFCFLYQESSFGPRNSYHPWRLSANLPFYAFLILVGKVSYSLFKYRLYTYLYLVGESFSKRPPFKSSLKLFYMGGDGISSWKDHFCSVRNHSSPFLILFLELICLLTPVMNGSDYHSRKKYVYLSSFLIHYSVAVLLNELYFVQLVDKF